MCVCTITFEKEPSHFDEFINEAKAIWKRTAQKVSEQFGQVKQSLVAAAGSLKSAVVTAWQEFAAKFKKEEVAASNDVEEEDVILNHIVKTTKEAMCEVKEKALNADTVIVAESATPSSSYASDEVVTSNHKPTRRGSRGGKKKQKQSKK